MSLSFIDGMIGSKRFDKMHVVNRMKWGGWKEEYTADIWSEQLYMHSVCLKLCSESIRKDSVGFSEDFGKSHLHRYV